MSRLLPWLLVAVAFGVGVVVGSMRGDRADPARTAPGAHSRDGAESKPRTLATPRPRDPGGEWDDDGNAGDRGNAIDHAQPGPHRLDTPYPLPPSSPSGELDRWLDARLWDLPPIGPMVRDQLPSLCGALGRIPRRQILAVLIDALEAEASEVRALADRFGNSTGPADREERHRARREVLQRFYDRLHRDLAPSDYLLIFLQEVGHPPDPHEPGEYLEEPVAVLRPVHRNGVRGANPYGNAHRWMRSGSEFARWYTAYSDELGLPVRRPEYLSDLYVDLVSPLGYLPSAAMLRQLVSIYDPYHSAGRPRYSGSGDEAKALLERARDTLPAVEWRTLALSERWNDWADRFQLIDQRGPDLEVR